MGFMDEFHLDNNYAVVYINESLDVQVGYFQRALEIPHGDILVVIGHGISGEIMSKNVKFDCDSRVSEDDEDLDCKISEVYLHDDMSILFYFYYVWRQ